MVRFLVQSDGSGAFSEPVLVGVLFPTVFVQVLVEVLFQFLVFFGHFDAERDSD